MKTLNWYEEDRWGDDEYVQQCCVISDNDADELLNLTPELLYNYVKDLSIGQVTPHGETKFVPCFEFGRFSLSIQPAYYLWRERDDCRYLAEQIDNSPMTEAEWNELFPSVESILDVKVWYGERVIVQATQNSCAGLLCALVNMLEY